MYHMLTALMPVVMVRHPVLRSRGAGAGLAAHAVWGIMAVRNGTRPAASVWSQQLITAAMQTFGCWCWSDLQNLG